MSKQDSKSEVSSSGSSQEKRRVVIPASELGISLIISEEALKEIDELSRPVIIPLFYFN